MKELYKEMKERLAYLESEAQTEEIQYRIKELTLAMVRVQQIMLKGLPTKTHTYLKAANDLYNGK